MTDRFETILDESISALQAGVPIEEILAETPRYASELRPLLYAAALLADPDPTLMPEETKTILRTEYMQQVEALETTSPPLLERLRAVGRIIKRRLTRRALFNDLMTVTITMLLTLLMLGLLINHLAQDTIPGDFLYGAKRISENMQLSLAMDEARQTELAEQFNQRRLAEIEQLIEANRAAVVRFWGPLETRGDNLWIVAGHTIFVPDDVIIEGEPQQGDTVQVIGLLKSNNVLVADTIKKRE